MPENADTKRLLFIKAANDICGTELENIRSVLGMLGIVHSFVDLTEPNMPADGIPDGNETPPDYITQRLKELGISFDYIYLAAHANQHNFGDADNGNTFDWDSLARAICESEIMNSESILFLGCCRGGLKRVARKLFDGCDKIDYVCGPHWKVTKHEIATAFHVFLYNMEFRGEEPSTAVSRASTSVGYRFFFHDRIEIENEDL